MKDTVTISTRIHKILKAFMMPIIKNAPFFIAYFLLNNIVAVLQTIHGMIAQPYNFVGVSLWATLSPLFVYFFEAYIMAAIITLTNKKWVKGFFYVLIFFLATVRIFIARQFGMEIGPLVLTLVAETNASETSEFIKTYILTRTTLGVFLTIAFYAAITIALEKTYPKYIITKLKSIKSDWRSAISVIFLIIFGIGVYHVCAFNGDIAYYMKNHTDRNGNIIDLLRDPFSKIYSTLPSLISTERDMKNVVRVTSELNDNSKSIFSDDSLNVVLVIGESYIKYHAKLYGYPLPTTPNMSREQQNGNLFAFTDVCSPYSHTTEAIRNLLCTNSIGKCERWCDTPYWPAIMKRTGFKVLMWDNQKISSTDVYEFTLNSLLYDSTLVRLSYDQVNDRAFTYDGEMLDAYKKEHIAYGNHNFIIFHLKGQHFEWDKRYPHTKELNHFTYKDIKRNDPWLNQSKRQYIAEYDNATLYNDQVMEDMFNMFRNTNTVIIYLSDHGEEVYDWRDSQARNELDMCGNLLKYQYDVPLIVWCSDKYKAAHPDIIKEMKSGLNHAFETDNTCQLLFHLAGISTRYYKPDRDPISDKYRKSMRLVDDSLRYDVMRWQSTR